MSSSISPTTRAERESARSAVFGFAFEGAENHRRWLDHYGAEGIHPPKRNSKKRSWSKRLRRWVAGIRQMVETVHDKLFNTFGLRRERPHEILGLRARLAARVALHNCENVKSDDLRPV
jgi:hypothetical protein